MEEGKWTKSVQTHVDGSVSLFYGQPWSRQPSTTVKGNSVSKAVKTGLNTFRKCKRIKGLFKCSRNKRIQIETVVTGNVDQVGFDSSAGGVYWTCGPGGRSFSRRPWSELTSCTSSGSASRLSAHLRPSVPRDTQRTQ